MKDEVFGKLTLTNYPLDDAGLPPPEQTWQCECGGRNYHLSHRWEDEQILVWCAACGAALFIGGLT